MNFVNQITKNIVLLDIWNWLSQSGVTRHTNLVLTSSFTGFEISLRQFCCWDWQWICSFNSKYKVGWGTSVQLLYKSGQIRQVRSGQVRNYVLDVGTFAFNTSITKITRLLVSYKYWRLMMIMLMLELLGCN